MTEAVEGDLVERLRAIAEWLPNSTSAHVSRGHCKELLVEDAAAIRRAIAALSDLRERFGLVDAKLIETYAAISRAEAEREDFRSRLATQCGHTLALITTGEALLTAVNNSDTTTAFWNERKALHQALQNARAAGLSRYQGSEEEKSDAN